MSRAGANRAVNLRGSAQWFNPDEMDESAYGPPPGASSRGTAAGAAGRGGPGSGSPAPGRGGPAGRAAPFAQLQQQQASPRYEQLMTHAEQQHAGGGAGGPTGRSGSNSRTLARPPSVGRAHPFPQMGNSGELPDWEPGGGGSIGGGGGMGGMRRAGSNGALTAAPGPAPLRGGPPAGVQVPDRPGTATTTHTERDGQGRTIVTKTIVTRTHSGRIRTEVQTTTSGPAHLVHGHGHGGPGVVEDAISPTRRSTPGSAPWAAGRGEVSPTAGPASPVTPPGVRRSHGGAVPGGSVLAGAAPASLRMSNSGGFGGLGVGGRGALTSNPPARPSLSGSSAGPAATAPGLRTSQSGMPPGAAAAATSRPGSTQRLERPSSAKGPAPQPSSPAGVHPSNLRSSWAGPMTHPAGSAAGLTLGGGGGGGAMRPASPARGPAVAAKPLVSPASPPTHHAPPSPGGGAGRAPSASRMRMAPGFAAAHGLGASGGGAAAELAMFNNGGPGGAAGGSATLGRPASGRYSTPGVMGQADSPEPPSPPMLTRPLVGGRPASVGRSPSMGPGAQAAAAPAARPVAPAVKPAAPAAVAPAAATRPVAAAPLAPAKPAATTPTSAVKPAAPAVVAVKPAAPVASAAKPAAPAAAAPVRPAAPAAAPKPAAPMPAAKPQATAAPPGGSVLDDKFRVKQNIGKLVAAAKMLGTRRNAGLCAVSLAFLRRFRAKLLRDRKDAALLCTSQVVQEVIKPMTQAAACRLTDLPELASSGGLVGDTDTDVGAPDYFISHAWSMGFLQLLDCCFNHLQGALDSTLVWLDIFAVNQHPGAEQKDDLDNLRTAIRLSQATLVCLDAAGTPLERVWCLYEFDKTLAIKGADALVLLTPGFSIREIASIFRSIDVDSAKATVLSDKDMILDDIRANHGSTQAFNAKLKLRFLLDPLDSKPDMMALAARAGADASAWDLGPVAAWLAQPAAPQVAVMTAAPGTGKSTITAVLCMGPEAAAEVAAAAAAGDRPDRPATAGRRPAASASLNRRVSHGSGGSGSGGVTVHAYHFCKYSDARRQDPVRVVKTLAYQLAHTIPALQPYYCGLDPGTLMQLHQPDAAARELLLMPLQQYARGQQVLLVIDALDEADKAPQPSHGSSAPPPSAPSALDNKVLQLLLHSLSLLPPCVRILTTARPEKHLVDPLRSRFPRLQEFVPSQLRRSDKTAAAMQTRLVERFGDAAAKQLLAAGGGGGREASLVYYPVVALLKAPLGGAAPAGLGQAYAAVFAQLWPQGKEAALGTQVQKLLEVLVAAQEPPPMSLLAALGLQAALRVLPGWNVLFFERDHSVHVLHRTLIEWLQDRRASGSHHADARRGHALLGKHLLAARPLGVYGARYLATHLIKAGSEPAALDAALSDLGYLEAACRTGDPFKLHAELASLPDERTTPVVDDVVRWLGLNGHVLWSHPGAVAQLASEAPRNSTVWQMGSRAAKKPVADMINEPLCWPLEVMALTQHKAPVSDVSYSYPDGRLMASASLDGSVRLWDADTGEPKAALPAGAPAHCLAYSPTGHLMATGGDTGGVALWDPTTGVQRAEMRGHKSAVIAVAFSVDGSLLASGGSDKVVRLWATFNGSQRAELKGHTGGVLPGGLAFSPDGSLLASIARDDPTARLWNASSGQLQMALEGHRQGVLAVAFSPSGSVLATASDTVRLWDAATGAALGALTDHIFPVAALAFTPDGGVLVSADTSHTLRLWAMDGGGGTMGRTRKPPTPKGRGPGGGAGGAPPAGVSALSVLEAPESGGQLSALAISPDGQLVATGSAAGELHVFAVGGGGGSISTVRAAHAGQIRRLAFSPDSRSLVSAADDCTLRLWEPRTALRQQKGGGGGEDGQSAGGAVAFSVHFCRGGRVAACVAEDGALTMYDAGAGVPMAPHQRAGGSGRPCCSRMSPDESTLAVGESDGAIRLWDMASGKLRARLKGHSDKVTDLAFSSADGDGASLASASEDCRARLWNAHTGQQTALLTGHTASVVSVAYGPDGGMVASGCEQGSIRLWPTGAGAGRSAAVLKGHGGSVLRLAFSPDGRRLASGGADYTARLWDVGSGSQLTVLKGHKEEVCRLAWGPTGRLLASGSRGDGGAGSVFVWDAASGQSVYAVHAAYMAGSDVACPGPGALCTVVSALEHAPHLTLITEAGGKGGKAGRDEVEAAGGRLRLRQVPVYTSFAAPASLAVARDTFVMAFGSHVYFYKY